MDVWVHLWRPCSQALAAADCRNRVKSCRHLVDDVCMLLQRVEQAKISAGRALVNEDVELRTVELETLVIEQLVKWWLVWPWRALAW
jgi:hypothetical protein